MILCEEVTGLTKREGTVMDKTIQDKLGILRKYITPPKQEPQKYFTRDYEGERRDAERARENERIKKTVPEAPPDVSVDNNIQEARKMNPLQFKDTVKNHGKWDYKRSDPKYENFGNFNYGAAGRAQLENWPLPEKAKDGFLRRAAGFYQQLTDRGKFKSDPADPEATYREASQKIPNLIMKPLGPPPHGDHPEDQEQIQKGIDYYHNLTRSKK